MSVSFEGPPDVTFRFVSDRDAPRRARQAIEQMMSGDDPIGPTVLLIASELVSNVVMHAGGRGVLRAWDPKPDVPLRLEVEDEVAFAQQAPTDLSLPVTAAIGGQGLRLVERLADAWGVTEVGPGKYVWAEIDRSQFRG